MRREIANQLSGPAAAAVDFTVGLAVGSALDRAASPDDLLNLAAAKDAIEQWVQNDFLKQSIDTLINKAVDNQSALQQNLARNIDALQKRSGLSNITQQLLLGLRSQTDTLISLHQTLTGFVNDNAGFPTKELLSQWYQDLGIPTKQLDQQINEINTHRERMDTLIEGKIKIHSAYDLLDKHRIDEMPLVELARSEEADKLITLIQNHL